MNENEVVISVLDNGIGINRSDQKFIFEKFYRAASTDVYNTKGSGLGLAFSKRVVEDHQGRFTLVSEIGRGSKFSLHFAAEDK